MPSPSVRQVRVRQVALISVALVGSWLLFEAVGGVHVGSRPVTLVLATTVSAAAIATLALHAAGRGLEHPRSLLVALAVVVSVTCAACKVVATAWFPDLGVPWPERPGWRCFSLSFLLATLPLMAFLYLWKRSDPVHPRAMGAALGAAAGAYSTAFVDLWCPVAHLPHVLLGHLLPMGILTGVCAAIGERVLGIRAHASDVRE